MTNHPANAHAIDGPLEPATVRCVNEDCDAYGETWPAEQFRECGLAQWVDDDDLICSCCGREGEVDG